jgi:preprotein translocase subunit SecB
MAQSPLQLRQYFFTKIICEAGLDFKKPPQNTESKLEAKVICSTSPHKGNNLNWRVVLDIKAFSPDQSVPYKLEFQVVGFFEVAPNFPEDRIKELVRITGSSILYSGAREFVLCITSRGPWEPVLLPTISFIEPIHPNETPAKKIQKRSMTSPKKAQK